MATVADAFSFRERRPDVLSGTPRAHSIDRWIFVAMAAWFIAIVLAGFIPDALMKIAAVRAGQRPPFPLIMHVHAVLMGSFMLLLLAQSLLMATGRNAFHKQLGIAAFALVPVLVVVGVVLAPTMYHQVWNGAHFGPPPVRQALARVVPQLENILLLQMRVGILFPLFVMIGLKARASDAGMHKRMMFLGTSVALGASIDRMAWLPSTSIPLSTDLWILLVLSPMFAWDVVRNQGVHRAYRVWFPIFVVSDVVLNLLWDTPWWHATARHIMGV